MPFQNRVTPFGEIIATPEHGTFMGNRGCLHDDQRRLQRQFCSERRWIICRTEFRGRKRTLMTPGHYTELFFLDEATALAAGHRPCAECRNTDYRRFKAAWMGGNGDAGTGTAVSANQIDQQLHRDRLTDDGQRRLHRANCGDLPDGAFVVLPDASTAYLTWGGRFHRWTASGYDQSFPFEDVDEVDVLTPLSTIRAIRAGYHPVVHPSAEHGSAQSTAHADSE